MRTIGWSLLCASALLFVACGAVGALVAVAIDPSHVVVGANGAALGMLCAWLVDEVKARLPVWKHQSFADGTEEWVNCA